jgi:hypothetical protein
VKPAAGERRRGDWERIIKYRKGIATLDIANEIDLR